MFKLMKHDNVYRWYSPTSGYFGPEFKCKLKANKWLRVSVGSFQEIMMKISEDYIALAGLWIAVFVCVVLMALALFTASSGHIEIRQSYSTGECVSMIVYDNEYPNGKVQPCPDVLPERYTHIWVQ